MYELIEKLKNLAPYTPVRGEFKARLNANESFIGQDNERLFSLLKNVDLNRYPDPYAVKTCAAFGEFYGVKPENVTAGNGSDELISIIVSCFLEKGDKILCFEPDFSMYFFYPKLYELNIKSLKKNQDFTIDFNEAIRFCERENIKCVMLSNPCNPTSVGIRSSEIERFVKSVSALVIIDEAYMEFWDERESLLGKVGDYNNLIVLRTCSKALGLAGIRLGFAVACEKLTKALRAAKSPYNVNVLTQEIGALVLQNKQLATERIELIKTSKNSLLAKLKERDFKFFEEIINSAANFFYIKTRDAKNVYKQLINKGIAVSRFGDYLRITCGSEEENDVLLSALTELN
jgi:histidinol-phosphate aminotransferase